MIYPLGTRVSGLGLGFLHSWMGRTMGLLRRSALGLVVIVILSLSFVKLSYGDDGAFSVGDGKHGGGSTMEELDNKYILTNKIVELQETVAKLEAAQKTHTIAMKRKDKKIRNLEKEVQKIQGVNKQCNLDVEETKKRAEVAEAKAETLTLAVSDFKAKLQKAERSLQIAETGMLKAQSEAASKAREIAKSADAWLPPWAATEFAKLQVRYVMYVQPVVNRVRKTVSVQVAKVNRVVKPYWKGFSKEVRVRWRRVKKFASPHLESAKKLGFRYVDGCKKYLSPYISKVQESIDPLVQNVRERTRPFIDQAANFLTPHLEKANTVTGPFVKQANNHYQSVVTQASNYHEHLQDSVKETLGKHEVFARWATKELIWFLASAVLALPVVALLFIFSSVFGGKKPTKRRHTLSSHNSSINSQTSQKKSRRAKPTTTDNQQK